MLMTRGNYFMRKKKLMEMSRAEPDGLAFKGVQLVMLGALIGVASLVALYTVSGQGR